MFSVRVADNSGGTCENQVLYADFDWLRLEMENEAAGKDGFRVSYFFALVEGLNAPVENRRNEILLPNPLNWWELRAFPC